MTGMGGGALSTNNSTIVTSFESALVHQLFAVLVIFALVLLVWNGLRSAQMRHAIAQDRSGTPGTPGTAVVRTPEPFARRILRVSFGLIWLLDGILQSQSAMPVGLANQVTGPTSTGSPSWVVHLVSDGVLIWNNHPVTAAIASVWIQIGIGLWLLIASRGQWSQIGAVVSMGWGLVVWGFGESFGGIFAPGATILFGAPGAVLFYCFAGGLIAMPERLWSTPMIGRRILTAMGLFLVGMAVLQSWPGRGFWQGAVRGHSTGTLVGMVDSMVGTPQPHFLSSWVASFGAFDAAHGFAVNLFVVIALATIGIALCSGQRRLLQFGVVAAFVFCLADWVLIEDFGFFGGLGTDPNSMIPIALLIVTGFTATARPGQVPEETMNVAEPKASFMARAKLDPSYAFRSLATVGAVLVVLLGAAPMALASTNPRADPIVTEATNGTPNVTNAPAPGFALTDQNGRPVSLASLRGKTVALTFLDPVCTWDCPLIGQAFREADLRIGAAANRTEFVAVVANPIYRSTFYVDTFDRLEGLNQLKNWRYLTGNIRALSTVWTDYGAEVALSPGGSMIGHSDIAYIIDPRGRIRYILTADPGTGTTSTVSSFATLLDQELNHVVGTS